MVKSYLKFEHARSFGVISSSTANVVWTTQRSGTGAGQAITAANEDVLCWDLKKGEQVGRWHDDKNKAQVTAIAQSPADGDIVAVGYEDGTIRLWDGRLATVMVHFNGHKAAVAHLAFDAAGVRLASGSKDTDIIVWDLVAETGLFKLRGHRDQITGLRFLEPTNEAGEPAGEGFLLTTAKDALVKLWDLASRHCIETHVAQRSGECWALGVAADGSGCITAGNDGELQVWGIRTAALAASTQQIGEAGVDASAAATERFLLPRGTLHRQGKERTVEVVFHPRQAYFAVHGVEKTVEIWRIRSEAEIKKALARKRRRRREKAAAAAKLAAVAGDVAMAEADNADEADEADEDVSTAETADVFALHVMVRTTGKVRSVDWAASTTTGGHKALQLLVGTTNNELELYGVSTRTERASKKDKGDKGDKGDTDEAAARCTRTLAVELPGHRTDVRAAALSSDDRMLATAAHGSLKVWNVRTATCIRTFACGYALCCAFLPGDQVVVVGTKAGALELFDVASAALLDSVEAHEGAVWTLQVHPDGRSVATGGADKTVRFWDFRIVQAAVLGTTRTTPQLRLAATRVLKVADDVLSVRFSPDARLLAVALLDSTVKVFFVDSLKLFLNLYGHKLPVLSMDISCDSRLLVTSSADKNVKIWGLDFGDCHRSLFAHQDSILQVAFVPHNADGAGHHFFSCSKDRALKYWDGDVFQQIQRLDGHYGEVWALAVAHSGRFVVTASHDKSIRVWDETDEPLFLEEEREREVEALYETTLATSLAHDADPEDAAAADGLPGDVGLASKPTTETLMAGERISEALALGMQDLVLLQEDADARRRTPDVPRAPPSRHIVFTALGNVSAEDYVLGVLQKIPAAALHDALLVLPFAQLPALFTFLARFAAAGRNVPLTCRVLFFVLKTHHRQIVASRTMRATLDPLRAQLRAVLQQQKDQIGRNMAALRVVGAHVRDQAVPTYVDETWEDVDVKQNARKREFVQVS